MPTVRDILGEKGNRVFDISADATVLDATRIMNHNKIGALVVSDEGRAVGIFTERDVLRRVVAQERSPARTQVAEVMTGDVVCATEEMDCDEVSRIMRDKRVRHMPVCDGDGGIKGMISIGDVNALHASDQEQQIYFLNEYIYGRV